MHRFPRNDAWGFQLDSGTLISDNRASSVDSVTERVNNSAKHALADGHINDRTSSLDDIAFLNFSEEKNLIVMAIFKR